MSGGLELNSAYRGVAASWLGLDTNIYARRGTDKNKNGKKCLSNEEHFEPSETIAQQNEKKKKGNTSSLIKERLEKKMSSGKYGSFTSKFEKKRNRPTEDKDEEEESKSSQVKAKKVKSASTASASSSYNASIQELNTRLLDTTLSKKARKRIRKKISMLSQNNT